MYKSLRFIGLCVSLLVFVALLGYVFLVAAKAQPEEVQCPCDYSQTIPKTQSCWTDPFETEPIYVEIFADELLTSCQISNNDFDATTRMDILTSACQIALDGNPGCDSASVLHTLLTPEQVNACQCELLAYVTSLNEVEGITVTGGPPYVCGNIDCFTTTIYNIKASSLG